MNFYNTLLVIVTVNCGEFLKHTLRNCTGEFKCHEFLKVDTLLVMVTVNCGGFLKHTLTNCDDEFR